MTILHWLGIGLLSCFGIEAIIGIYIICRMFLKEYHLKGSKNGK